MQIEVISGLSRGVHISRGVHAQGAPAPPSMQYTCTEFLSVHSFTVAVARRPQGIQCPWYHPQHGTGEEAGLCICE